MGVFLPEGDLFDTSSVSNLKDQPIATTINVYPTLPNGKRADSFQTSPAWVLCFIPFRYPSPIDAPTTEDLNSTKAPIVVDSDCISLVVNQDKHSHNPSMEAVLLGGKYNYLATISPGDYVTVNICNFSSKIETIKTRIASELPVNQINYGFKGVFRVQSVRQNVMIDPATGRKRVSYSISAIAFTELNNVIYFNPYITPQNANDLFWYTTVFQTVFNGDKNNLTNAFSLERMIGLLLSIILGSGISSSLADAKKITPNRQFQINSTLAKLLGLPNAKYFRQAYRFYFGVQRYAPAPESEPNAVLRTVPAFIPENQSTGVNQIYSSEKRITGITLINPEYWNKVSGYGLISQYVNPPMNEMFTHFKVVPESNGLILPCLTFRQTPFSSLVFKNDFPNRAITPFLTLPRWKIDTALIRSMSIGRDDTFRTNFVQIFSYPQNLKNPQVLITDQIARNNNTAVDRADVLRSGLHPQTLTSHFDLVQKDTVVFSPFWSQLVGDATIGSHMKLSGTLETVGIEQDITVGDNLQVDQIVYHIESLSHRCQVSPSGSRSFVTSIALSQGVDDTREEFFKVYGERINSSYQDAQRQDYENGANILPAVSNDQVTPPSSFDLGEGLETVLPAALNLGSRA